MKKLFFLGLVMGLVLSLSSAANAAEEKEAPKALPIGAEGTLVLADFNSWDDTNSLGGAFGGWAKNPDDPTQQCLIEITDEDKVGDKGNSLKMNYRVDSPTQAYNGFWMKLQDGDFSSYKYLVVSVKGVADAGFTPRFKIEIKNKQKEAGHYILTGVTDKWQQFVIPLKDFGLSDMQQMGEFVIVFDDIRCRPKVGSIYIDDIYVSK